MIVLLKKKPGKDELTNLVEWLCSMGLDVHVSEGKERMLLGLIGDTSCVDIDLIRALDIVDDVKRIQEPFKNANRKLHPDDSRIDLGVTLIGGGTFQLIAGPYLIETEEQICTIAREVKQAGATMLRGGAFSPAHFAVCIPGPSRGRNSPAACGKARNGPPRRHGADGYCPFGIF